MQRSTPPSAAPLAAAAGATPGDRLGVVTGGSFSEGLTVRLDTAASTEALRVGDFVVLEGERSRYFSMISDMRLEVTDHGLAADPPPAASPFIRRALAGTHTYATVQVKPSLVLRDVAELTAEERRPEPVRNIPMHFAELRQATQLDVDAVFGRESETRFALGTPLTMDTPVCIDLERLVQRSTGVFGQSGTGKSVLTRLLLCGIIRSRTAGVLIFDMHGEYADGQRAEEAGGRIAGLREIFGSRIVTYAIDDPTHRADHHLQIGLNQIETGDIALLAEELALRDTFEATTSALRERFGERWLARLLAMTDRDELQQFCEQTGAHPMALEGLRGKLRRLAPRERPYIVEQSSVNSLDGLLDTLQAGRHVVLQFGRCNALLDYILVANIITRRLHQRYTELVQRYETTRDEGDRPRPLVIVIEEAHKFLHPGVAHQTIFGTIAREMRKYYVTLLIVDQRPSGIDSEVLSQVGTRITGLLTEERDIEAVLTGIAGRSHLRGVLASLETKQQCLIMGHAIPMPMVLRTRAYDQAFVQAIKQGAAGKASAELRSISALELSGKRR
jgi:DNA helicase HerA-like ATPase